MVDTKTKSTYRSLLVTFSDLECVLKDGVHDPTDAKGGLDYVGNNFLHCEQTKNRQKLRVTEVVFVRKKIHSFPTAHERISPCRVFWNRFTLTMSFVSLNVLPSVSMVKSLQRKKNMLTVLEMAEPQPFHHRAHMLYDRG